MKDQFNPEVLQGSDDEYRVAARTLNVGETLLIPGFDGDTSVNLVPTKVDKNGGVFVTAYINPEDLGVPVANKDTERYLYFGPNDKRIEVGKQIDIEKYEIESSERGSKRKYLILGSIAATVATGIIVRRIKKN